MSKLVTEPRVIDGLRFARRIQPGCMHMLGCKCDPPMWLREPSPAELARWYSPPEREQIDHESYRTDPTP